MHHALVAVYPLSVFASVHNPVFQHTGLYPTGTNILLPSAASVQGGNGIRKIDNWAERDAACATTMLRSTTVTWPMLAQIQSPCAEQKQHASAELKWPPCGTLIDRHSVQRKTPDTRAEQAPAMKPDNGNRHGDGERDAVRLRDNDDRQNASMATDDNAAIKLSVSFGRC